MTNSVSTPRLIDSPSHLGVVLLLVLLAFQFASAQSNRFEAGIAALQRSQYTTAFRSWLPLAEDGLPEAQLNLGHLYHEGLGVEVDYDAAFLWYQRAAESGLAEAQFNLGLLYYDGAGVPRDRQTALELFREAEAQSVAAASYMLGLEDLRGELSPLDPERCRRRVLLAARAGVPSAQFTYAMLAQSGQGGRPEGSRFLDFQVDRPVQGDPLVTYVWARLAQENGLESADLIQVIEVAEIMLGGDTESAEQIIKGCLENGLSDCPTAD
ncbi:MAG: tetratricopeptide repeat protein [Pseudomonadota bacterium]|nr:tetratricopeptide repeat protein [Pseudomonadota bacterium]